jgi:hypothetical protein
MSCEISNLPKYQKRKSPSIPANDCELGIIETGNDGNLWQIVAAGKSQRWVKCGTGSTNCGNVNNKSTKKVKKTKISKSKPSSSETEQHFLVKGKIFLNKVSESREKLPDNQTLYKYMNKNSGFINELVENIAGYQMLYDKLFNQQIDQNLNLTFNITNENGGHNSDYRIKYHKKENMSANEIKKDLESSIRTFGDGCYGSSPPSECLYPDSNGGVLAEISIKSLTVTKVNNPNSKSVKPKTSSKTKKVSKKTTGKKECPPGKVLSPKGRCVKNRSNSKKSPKKSTGKKECPPGKVLSPKGRCVIDRSQSKKSPKKSTGKKKCPPGKVLSPKGRCVIDRSKSKKSPKKSTEKKKCPPGKVLSPKGRCVIDRSKSTKSSKKLTKKKECPPGKILSPKGRCVKDRSLPTNNITNNNRYIITKKPSKTSKNPQVTDDYGSCVSPEFRLESNLPPLPKKYHNRPGPPYPANECSQGDIKLGNDGNLYQNLLVNGRNGKTLRWVKCGRAGTQC